LGCIPGGTKKKTSVNEISVFIFIAGKIRPFLSFQSFFIAFYKGSPLPLIHDLRPLIHEKRPLIKNLSKYLTLISLNAKFDNVKLIFAEYNLI